MYKLWYLLEKRIFVLSQRLSVWRLFTPLLVDGYGQKTLEVAAGRFYGDSLDWAKVARIAQYECGDQCREVLHRAELACHNRFLPGLASGEVLAWDTHAKVTWEHPPSVKESSSDNVVRQLNRQGFLLDLAQAAWLTNDSKYVDCAARLLSDWIAGHPLGTGPSWWEVLEVAKRSDVWLWVYYLLRDHPSFAEINSFLLQQLAINAGYLYRHLSHHAPNNHLISEAKSLAIMGLLLENHPRAYAWWIRGRDQLIIALSKQTHPDGVNAEQSMGYHLLACREALEFMLIAQANDEPIPDGFRAMLTSMLTFIVACLMPDGNLPHFGDSESVYLEQEVETVLLLAAHAIGDPQYRLRADHTDYKALWYLSGRKSSSLVEPTSSQPIPFESRSFPQGGHTILKAPGRYLIFHHGPFGLDIPKVHGHADALALEVADEAGVLLADPGSYLYINDRWRAYFRGTRSHNTVVIDDVDQTPLYGALSTGRRAKARLERAAFRDGFEVVSASHTGYERLPGKVLHRRRVIFIRSQYYLIVDAFEGNREHKFEQMWHFPPDAQIEIGKEKQVRVFRQGQLKLSLIPVLIDGVNVFTHRGEEEPVLGWIASGWEQRIATTSLRYTRKGLPAESAFLTLILPGTVEVVKGNTKNGEHVIVRHEEGFELLSWQSDTEGDEEFVAWWANLCGIPFPFAFKGEMLLACFDPNGDITDVITSGVERYHGPEIGDNLWEF